MAKGAKTDGPETIIDNDGYETDGMYRWGGPKIPYSHEVFEHFAESFNRCLKQSAIDRIAELRERVTALIQPFVEGPYPPDDFDRHSENLRGCTITYLNLSIGSGACAIRKGISDKSYINDAISALRALDELTALLSKKPLNIDWIVRSSIEVGSLITRAELRAYFAPEVLVARKHRNAAAKGGKSTAKWNAEIEALARPIFAELKRGKLSDDAAYKRTALRLYTEHGREISASTLRRHLAGPSNA